MDDVEINIYNQNFELIHILDAFQSFIWNDRYYEYGDFEIYVPISMEAFQYFKRDHYVWYSKSVHWMIIEELRVTSDADEGDMLIVTGRSLESILLRRLFLQVKTFKEEPLEDFVFFVLENNVITRPLVQNGNFILKRSDDEHIKKCRVNMESNGDRDVYDVIREVCSDRDVGFKITVDDQYRFVFELYYGVDRSYDQLELPFVVFADAFENIVNVDYQLSNVNYHNYAYVTSTYGTSNDGAGERIYTEVWDRVEGMEEPKFLDRREVYIMASDITQTVYNDDGSTSTRTKEQVLELLKDRGKQQLNLYVPEHKFEGEIDVTGVYKYDEDFFMGDIVQIEASYGIEARVRITEFIQSIDQDGLSTYPTFKVIEDKGVDE